MAKPERLSDEEELSLVKLALENIGQVLTPMQLKILSERLLEVQTHGFGQIWISLREGHVDQIGIERTEKMNRVEKPEF